MKPDSRRSLSSRTVQLAGETDFDGFRHAVRRLLQDGCEPDHVDWQVAGSTAPELFATAVDAPDGSPAGAPLRVPANFIEQCRSVVLHSDRQRFALLYRLLWRLHHDAALRLDPLDADRSKARLMAHAVRRDQHKMKAFVRFREVAQGAGQPVLHVAWFEPDHHIVEAVAPFFVRRFTAMPWAILTPECSLRWDGAQLHIGPAASKRDAPPPDAGEALWLTYYDSIFNPARLKLRAMEKEMPRRYWRNLPEAALISGLAAQAQERSGGMLLRQAQPPLRRVPIQPAVALSASWSPSLASPPLPAVLPAHACHLPPPDTMTVVQTIALPDTLQDRGQQWQAQRAAAAACRECPLGALATQTVWGEGPVTAALMLVGEQPGDQEDLQGKPFVGPAGQLLNRAMAQLDWDRAVAYVTNAVKHFKYEPRGKRRIHKTPAQREADACNHWLESEIALVQPKAIVALGATAARQLLGRPVAVTRERGQWLQRADGLPVLITLHPSALLRTDLPDRDAAYAAWLQDLRLASVHAQPGAAAGAPMSSPA